MLYNQDDNSCILNLNSHGRTVICQLQLERNGVVSSSFIYYFRADNTEKSNLQKSIGMDYAKCNDMYMQGDFLFCAMNSGNVFVYKKQTDGRWSVMENPFDIQSTNPGYGVESICITSKNSLLCGTTGRQIQLVNFDVREDSCRWNMQKTLKGVNCGIRRVLLSKDGKKLFAMLYNNGICILSRDADHRFSFENKVFIGENHWCWAAAEGDGVLFTAAENKIYRIGETLDAELLCTLDSKVENIFLADKGFILAAVDRQIKKINTADGTAVTVAFTSRQDYGRAMCFGKNPATGKIYAGYTTHGKNNDKGAVLSCVDTAKNKQTVVKNSQSQYSNGWYRTVEFTSDGQYCLCAGLNDENGNSVAVLLNSDMRTACTLGGHGDYVTDAKIVQYSPEQKNIVATTCSYDGRIALHNITVGTEPCVKTIFSHNTGDRLFNMVCDDKDILCCSLEGRIFRWENSCQQDAGELKTEFINNNLWITYCDFTAMDKESKLSAHAKKQLLQLSNIF